MRRPDTPGGQMIGFAYCHGWSFDAGSLAPLRAELARRFPHAAQAVFDLGFTCAPQSPQLAPDVTWIALGHSYGFVWLMQQPQPWRAAISINGFTRFCRHAGRKEGAPVRRIDAMLAKIPQDAQAVVSDFQAHCGAQTPVETATQARLDQAALAAHLVRVRDLDLSLPDCPTLALASSDDIVVPQALTQACFAHGHCTLREFSGDHLRLLREPAAAADAIVAFLESIDA